MKQLTVHYWAGLMPIAAFLLAGTMQLSGSDDIPRLRNDQQKHVTITIDRVLVSPVSMVHPRVSPNTAMMYLDEQVREKYPQIPFHFEILPVGPDLRLEGITYSRAISIDHERATVAEVLTTILAQLNPLRGAELHSDRMLVVWGIEQDSLTGEPQIVVTTRRGAEKRGLQVPDVFARKDGRLPEPSPLLRPLKPKHD